MYVAFEGSRLRILHSTAEVFTDTGWKQADALQVGDRVRDPASDPRRPRWLIVRGFT